MKTNKPCEMCGKPADQLHHKFSNSKAARKMYSVLLDQPFNMMYICVNCHMTKPLVKYTELEFRQEAIKAGYNLPAMSKSLQFNLMREVDRTGI